MGKKCQVTTILFFAFLLLGLICVQTVYAASSLEISLKTDKPAYHKGETYTVTWSVKNTGGADIQLVKIKVEVKRWFVSVFKTERDLNVIVPAGYSESGTFSGTIPNMWWVIPGSYEAIVTVYDSGGNSAKATLSVTIL